MSEGLESMQHENVAPSDDDLINELSAVTAEAEAVPPAPLTAAHEATQRKLAALDAPAEGTITEEAVAGEKAGAETAPDSTLLRDELQTLLATKEAEPEISPELQELKRMNDRMLALQEQQLTGLTPAQAQALENTPEKIAQRAAEAAAEARAETNKFRQELADREEEARLNALEAKITAFVSTKKDDYPITNYNEDSKKLVAVQMLESLQAGNPMSEDEALVFVEDKLRSYVEGAAAALGWTKPGTQQRTESSNEETGADTITKEAISSATGNRVAWDDMSFEDRDAALEKLL